MHWLQFSAHDPVYLLLSDDFAEQVNHRKHQERHEGRVSKCDGACRGERSKSGIIGWVVDEPDADNGDCLQL